MATYDAITDAEILAGKPWGVVLAGKNRDNPLAMFEGASGAPRLHHSARIAPVTGTVTTLFSDATEYTTAVRVDSQLILEEHSNFPVGGVYKYSIDIYHAFAGTQLYLYRNGTLYHSFAPTGAYATYTKDVTLAPGDLLQLRTGTTFATLAVKNRFIQVGNAAGEISPIRSV